MYNIMGTLETIAFILIIGGYTLLVAVLLYVGYKDNKLP